MQETIQRIERQLKSNHYVEAEDIRALLEAYKSTKENLTKAESFIDELEEEKYKEHR